MGQHRFSFFSLVIAPHVVLHVTQTQADEREGGEKTARKGKVEKRKLV